MKQLLKSEEGFTLLETLLSLLVSSFVFILLTGGLLQLITIRETLTSQAQPMTETNKITGDRQLEWHIFLNQFENYLQGSYDPEILGSTLRVKEAVDTIEGYQIIDYRMDNRAVNFSRRVSNGYHRMLTGIESLNLKKEGGWLKLHVQFLNGERFTGQIWMESWLDPDDQELEENDEELGDEEDLENEEKLEESEEGGEEQPVEEKIESEDALDNQEEELDDIRKEIEDREKLKELEGPEESTEKEKEERK